MTDEQGRTEPPWAGNEVDAALGFLDFQRATLEWKTRGLGEAGMRSTTAASTMTLGGLLKHMAFVEDYWFTYRLFGEAPSELFRSADWEADPDWEWHSAGDDDAATLLRLWTDAVAKSRSQVDRAMAGAGFDTVSVKAHGPDQLPNLRWIVLHMIEEYARHNGHADLLREAWDGETGE